MIVSVCETARRARLEPENWEQNGKRVVRSCCLHFLLLRIYFLYNIWGTRSNNRACICAADMITPGGNNKLLLSLFAVTPDRTAA